MSEEDLAFHQELQVRHVRIVHVLDVCPKREKGTVEAQVPLCLSFLLFDCLRICLSLSLSLIFCALL